MEFTSDKMIKELQDRLTEIKEWEQEGYDTFNLRHDYTILVMFVQRVTGRKVVSHDGQVMWED